MFFWNKTVSNNKLKNKQNEKESSSFLEHTIYVIKNKLTVEDFPKSKSKRILLCTFSNKLKGSITVESSYLLPLFIFAMMCLVYLLEMLAIQMAVRSGIHEVAYIYSTKGLENTSINVGDMETDLIKFIGEENLENSIIKNGSDGLDLSETGINYSTGVVELCVEYQVKLPVPGFLNLGMNYEERIKFKR